MSHFCEIFFSLVVQQIFRQCICMLNHLVNTFWELQFASCWGNLTMLFAFASIALAHIR